MRNLTIKVEEANDIDVACALATLAGFSKGSLAGKVNNVWHKEVSRECAYVFHKDTLYEVNGDLVEAMAYHGPDIIVMRIHKFHKLDSPTPGWQPTDEYEVRFNDKFVESSLLDSYKIGEAIRGETKRVESRV